MKDLVVIGGGHAGTEAAAAAARAGVGVTLVTPSRTGLARLSCNPAMGGTAKGQLAREVDALGGLMALATDRAAIHYRMLNRSKGPAVWSPRAQVDRERYTEAVDALFAERYPSVEILEGTVASLELGAGRVRAVRLEDGRRLPCRRAVLCAGTFLRGLTHTGGVQREEGRAGEPPSVALSRWLENAGFPLLRFKTGTPPRVHRDSLDLAAMEPQESDREPWCFSHESEARLLPQRACYRARTAPTSHAVITANLDRAPLYNGTIQSVGPRYCPSIEDKVVRFPERDHHTLVFEPEGLDHPLMYVNGFSTSLPEEAQAEALRAVPGCEFVRFARPGYAVEYDVVPPRELSRSLESRRVPGLYLAGQVNGTSGYEEAGVQGLLAGANAALSLLGRPPIVLGRDQAYAGVLVDDLITIQPQAPYRMFTSRAEHRLLLRQDNAEERLHEVARRAGLITSERYEAIRERVAQTAAAIEELRRVRVPVGPVLGATEDSERSAEAASLFERPEALPEKIFAAAAPSLSSPVSGALEHETVRRQVEIELRYRGYLERERRQVERLRRSEDHRLPADLDYASIRGLSAEAAEQLGAVRPETLGQAGRIEGVRTSDLALLLVAARRCPSPRRGA